MLYAELEPISELTAKHGLRAGQHRNDADLEFLRLRGAYSKNAGSNDAYADEPLFHRHCAPPHEAIADDRAVGRTDERMTSRRLHRPLTSRTTLRGAPHWSNG